MKHLREGHTTFDPRCEICIQAKLQSKPARWIEREETGGEVSADTAGPIPISINGNLYGIVCVIRKSRYGLVQAMKNKEAQTLKDSMIECRLHQRHLWRFHSDQGREFLGECQRWLKDSGLDMTDTGGYQEPANSIAERQIKEEFQTARALLLQSNGPKVLWDEAVLHSNALINNTLRAIPGQAERFTPHELEVPGGERADLSKWPPWGCQVFYFIPKVKHDDKLDPVAAPAIFVGFDSSTVGGHQVVPYTFDEQSGSWELSKTFVATTIRVFENVFPLREKGPRTDILEVLLRTDGVDDTRDTPRSWRSDAPAQARDDHPSGGSTSVDPERPVQPTVPAAPGGRDLLQDESAKVSPWPDGKETIVSFDLGNPYRPQSATHTRYEQY